MQEELRRAVMEFEKAQARGAGASLMALHYALGPLREAIRASGIRTEVSDAISKLLNEILEHVEKVKADRGGQLRRTVSEIAALLGRAARSSGERGQSPA